MQQSKKRPKGSRNVTHPEITNALPLLTDMYKNITIKSVAIRKLHFNWSV
jgi:hypothetical protein